MAELDPEKRTFVATFLAKPAGLVVTTEVTDLVRRSVAPILIDAPEAARLMGISLQAFQQRVWRGQVPRTAIVRTGRRVQFVRARLPGIK